MTFNTTLTATTDWEIKEYSPGYWTAWHRPSWEYGEGKTRDEAIENLFNGMQELKDILSKENSLSPLMELLLDTLKDTISADRTA